MDIAAARERRGIRLVLTDCEGSPSSLLESIAELEALLREAHLEHDAYAICVAQEITRMLAEKRRELRSCGERRGCQAIEN